MINDYLLERIFTFHSNLSKPNSFGCIEWLGNRHKKGYGQYRYLGKMIKAHRFSWIIYRGEIPNDLWVLHKCDNPPCINPLHLWLGTNKDNTDDRDKKGRHHDCKGENHGRHKLTEDQVRYILKANSLKTINQSKMARELGVSPSLIKFIVDGKTWTHINRDEFKS